MPRRVVVEVETLLDLHKVVELFLRRYNYELIEITGDHAILVKGSKVLTYIGFTNWEYVYRRMRISLSGKREKNYVYRLDYEFSWLTNIGFLRRGVYIEVNKLAKDKALHIKSIK